MNLPQDFDFSQSNLQDYLDCPYRFYMRYIRRIKWPALVVDDALDFEQRSQSGARFHRLIQQYLLDIPEDRLSDLAEADPNPAFITWWEDFHKTMPTLLNGERFVEVTLTAHLAGMHLLAKYDLILADQNGNLTIFDWKTSRKKPRKDWLLDRVQTRLYRWILNQAGAALVNKRAIKPEQITMIYWFTASPDAPVVLPYDQSGNEKDHAYFLNLVEEIQARSEENFTRTQDSKKCRYCIYRSHCDRGVEAGDFDSYDDFNEALDESDLDIDFESISEIEF